MNFNQLNSPLESISGSHYVNHIFKLGFVTPENWFIVNPEQYRSTWNKQTFRGIFEDIKEEVFNFIGWPILILTKYDPISDENNGIVSPTINFSAEFKKDQEIGTTLEQYAQQIEIKLGLGFHLLNEFKVIERGKVYDQKGFSFIKYKTSYLFEHQDLEEPVTVEMDVLNIDYHDFFLDFSMTQCKSQNQMADKEFLAFENSILLSTEWP